MVIHEILPFCIYQARPRNDFHRHERCHDVQLAVCQTSSQVSHIQFLETHVYAEVAVSTFEIGKGGGILTPSQYTPYSLSQTQSISSAVPNSDSHPPTTTSPAQTHQVAGKAHHPSD
jgi:hypothetical protein